MSGRNASKICKFSAVFELRVIQIDYVFSAAIGVLRWSVFLALGGSSWFLAFSLFQTASAVAQASK